MSNETPRRLAAVFYRTAGRDEVVLDWLRGLDPDDRLAIGLDPMRVQFRWPIGMPLCRPLGSGLLEVRTSLSSGCIARMLFWVHDTTIIVLSGFIKKTQKTPDRELTLARKRMKEFLP